MNCTAAPSGFSSGGCASSERNTGSDVILRDALPAQERREAEIEIARAPAEHERVERDEDGAAADRLGALHETLRQRVRFAPIELIEARAVAILAWRSLPSETMPETK